MTILSSHVERSHFTGHKDSVDIYAFRHKQFTQLQVSKMRTKQERRISIMVHGVYVNPSLDLTSFTTLLFPIDSKEGMQQRV